jgi:Leucine-rich repeat (LRR) protein
MRKKEKIAARDNQVSISTRRGHFLTSKQKEKPSLPIQIQDNWKDETTFVNHESNDTKVRLKADTRVGAFAIAGIGGGTSDDEEPSLPVQTFSMAQRIQSMRTSFLITSTRELDNVNAVVVEGPITKPFRKHRLIFVVSSLLLMVIIIILVVILTRRSPNFDAAAADAFLENLIPLLTNASRQELENSGSAQSLALTWLLKNSNFNEYPLHRQVQRFALAVFYFSTEGKTWHQRKGWLTDDDECTWYQSSIKGLCVNTTLQIISLKNNNLRGLLPNDIALLRSIKVLDLDSNVMEGIIPSEVGQCTELTMLNLRKNMLNGDIPSEIGQCTRLQMLDLSNNHDLYESIPSEIGQCTELEELYLDSNNLHGLIPSEIGQCTRLKVLDISYMYDLHGTIPSEIGKCTKLQELYLYDNSLYGVIPNEIGQCTRLEMLDLSYTHDLQGTIPPDIGHCTELRELYLHGNSLYGSIPSEISALTNLESLYILNNSVTGTIPENLCKLEMDLNVGNNVECSCC